MKPPYFIETLARNGEVLHRQRVAALPLRLGRGYDNDVILDDAHTAARHAIIEADGEGMPVLRDLGSQNGCIHRGKRLGSIALDGDTVVRLGHSNLRLRGADHPVPAELTDTTMHGWEGGTPALLGLGLIGATALLTNWLNDTQPFQAVAYLLVLSYALAGGLVWSGVWAFGNRLFGRHARLGRHLFILGCGLAALEAWKLSSSVLAYSYSMEALTRYGRHAIIAIVCCMVFFHLRTIKPHHPRRLAAACMVLLLIGSSLGLMSNLQLSGRVADEPYMAVLLPPAFRLSPDHTPEEFFGRAAKLKSGVDAERARAAAGETDDDTE
ncbi:FHA domain-containing protein [Janthinobacterium fluminis]|uniref:FHA domain-containing protein n=1 Tax=Janthinobacterium fluminis TaxID=2987524 RepID=A0ABT5JTM4_9BURK|nr:FHA domain-containing protein [Janthinobacterium fluminis]MDC8756097.1 FHA domain-containing protein [Janthinobacterium fluminis]